MSDSLQPHGLQAPLSMGSSRQEYWSGSHSLFQGIFPTPGIEPVSPASLVLAGGFFYHCATCNHGYNINTILYAELIVTFLSAIPSC